MAVFPYNPWNQEAEAGDIMVSSEGRAWRLYESNGRNKRDLGELPLREIKKHGKIAKIIDGKIVWEPKSG